MPNPLLESLNTQHKLRVYSPPPPRIYRQRKGGGGGGGGGHGPPYFFRFLYCAPLPLLYKTNGSPPPPPPTLNLLPPPMLYQMRTQGASKYSTTPQVSAMTRSHEPGLLGHNRHGNHWRRGRGRGDNSQDIQEIAKAVARVVNQRRSDGGNSKSAQRDCQM